MHIRSKLIEKEEIHRLITTCIWFVCIYIIAKINECNYHSP